MTQPRTELLGLLRVYLYLGHLPRYREVSLESSRARAERIRPSDNPFSEAMRRNAEDGARPSGDDQLNGSGISNGRTGARGYSSQRAAEMQKDPSGTS